MDARTRRIEQEIRRLYADMQRQFAAGRFDAALNFYAQEAVLLAPGAPPLHGNDAIRAELERTFAGSGVRVTLSIAAIHISSGCDMAYVHGSGTSDPGNLRTKWLAVLAPQADGRWRVVADLFNSAP